MKADVYSCTNCHYVFLLDGVKADSQPCPICKKEAAHRGATDLGLATTITIGSGSGTSVTGGTTE